MNRSEYTLLLHLANKPKVIIYLRDILEHPWSTKQECSERTGLSTTRNSAWDRMIHAQKTRDCIESNTKPIYCKQCGHLIRRVTAYRIKPGHIEEVRTVLKALEEDGCIQ